MANCVHGFAEGQCLICQTLAKSQPSGSPAAPALKVAERPTGRSGVPFSTGAPFSAGLPVTQGGGTAKAVRRRHHFGLGSLVGILALIGLGILLAWAFAGVIGLAVHIAGYVAVAAVAGWAGYRVGHLVGRHQRSG
jgi:hypothetical protein